MSQTIGTIVANVGQNKMRREGRRMQSKAQEAIDNFEYQGLDRTPSTLGADLIKEELGRSNATMIDALRQGGSRAVLGGFKPIQENTNNVLRGVAANLDEQQKQIDASNEMLTERRQAEQLAGYGQMLNVGMGMKYKAYSDFYATAAAQSQHIMDLWSTFGGGMGSSSGFGGAGGSSGGGAASASSYNSGMPNNYHSW